jgi:hypothetical protein
MVVLAPSDDSVDIRCGGVAMVELGSDIPEATLQEGADLGTQIGKRYINEGGTLEVLCTKPGKGALGSGEGRMNVKGAKPLPSSD